MTQEKEHAQLRGISVFANDTSAAQEQWSQRLQIQEGAYKQLYARYEGVTKQVESQKNYQTIQDALNKHAKNADNVGQFNDMVEPFLNDYQKSLPAGFESQFLNDINNARASVFNKESKINNYHIAQTAKQTLQGMVSDSMMENPPQDDLISGNGKNMQSSPTMRKDFLKHSQDLTNKLLEDDSMKHIVNLAYDGDINHFHNAVRDELIHRYAANYMIKHKVNDKTSGELISNFLAPLSKQKSTNPEFDDDLYAKLHHSINNIYNNKRIIENAKEKEQAVLHANIMDAQIDKLNSFSDIRQKQQYLNEAVTQNPAGKRALFEASGATKTTGLLPGFVDMLGVENSVNDIHDYQTLMAQTDSGKIITPAQTEWLKHQYPAMEKASNIARKEVRQATAQGVFGIDIKKTGSFNQMTDAKDAYTKAFVNEYMIQNGGQAPAIQNDEYQKQILPREADKIATIETHFKTQKNNNQKIYRTPKELVDDVESLKQEYKGDAPTIAYINMRGAEEIRKSIAEAKKKHGLKETKISNFKATAAYYYNAVTGKAKDVIGMASDKAGNVADTVTGAAFGKDKPKATPK